MAKLSHGKNSRIHHLSDLFICHVMAHPTRCVEDNMDAVIINDTQLLPTQVCDSIGFNRVGDDVCIRCGKCQQVCPVDNIKGTPPEWMHNGKCTCCLACYHYCPVHAINYGKITRRRGQYHFRLVHAV